VLYYLFLQLCQYIVQTLSEDWVTNRLSGTLTYAWLLYFREELDKKMDASERRKKRKSTTTITELTANNSLLPDGAVGEGVQTITVGLVGERGELVEVNKRVRTSYKAAHQNGQTKVVVRQVVEDDDAMEDEVKPPLNV